MNFRERFDNQSQNNRGVPVMKIPITVNVQFCIDSQNSCSSYSADQFSIENSQCQEVISIEGLPPESTSPQSGSEDLHVESQSAELKIQHYRIEEQNEATKSPACFNSLDSTSQDLYERSQSPELNSLHSTAEYLREGSQSPEINSLCFRSRDVLEESQSHELNSLLSCSEYPLEGSQSPELNSLQFRCEDLNDGSQSTEASWDERNLWVRNLDWQRTVESSNVHGWQSGSEVVPEEIEPCTQQDIVNTGRMGGSYISWRGWEIDSQEYRDYFETFSDKVEIRELLKRY